VEVRWHDAAAYCNWSNDLGLFDMHGNVEEWCQERSWLAEAVEKGDEVVLDEVPRMHRGGAFALLPTSMRSTKRNDFRPGEWHKNIGFRVVRTHP
jgi:formylglycine-generating enzyme required for sulfatase activity